MVSITSTFSQEEESPSPGQHCQWSCHIESCRPCWREVKICTYIQQYKLRRDEDIFTHWNIFVVIHNLMWCTCFIFWEAYSSILKNWKNKKFIRNCAFLKRTILFCYFLSPSLPPISHVCLVWNFSFQFFIPKFKINTYFKLIGFNKMCLPLLIAFYYIWVYFLWGVYPWVILSKRLSRQ